MTQDWFGITIDLLGGYFIGVNRDTSGVFLGEQIFRKGRYTGNMVRAGISVVQYAEGQKGRLDMKKLMQKVKLRVKFPGIPGVWGFRLKIATWLIRLGARIAWFRVRIGDRPVPLDHAQCRSVIDYGPCKLARGEVPDKKKEFAKVGPIQEGMVKKGGVNNPPTTPRPDPPEGMGGKGS